MGEIDVAKLRAGEVARIYEVQESVAERIEPGYDLEFTGRDEALKVHLKD